MNKLKIEHLPLLVGYLPYKLKLRIEREGRFIGDPNVIEREIWNMHDINILFNKRYRTVSVKPILKPMEMFIAHSKDIFKNIDIEEIKYLKGNLLESPVIKLSELNDFAGDFYTINYLYQNHYDIHGLISRELAVDWREIDVN